MSRNCQAQTWRHEPARRETGSRVRATHLVGANRSDAQLACMKLNGVKLNGAGVTGANLRGPDLTGGAALAEATLIMPVRHSNEITTRRAKPYPEPCRNANATAPWPLVVRPLRLKPWHHCLGSNGAPISRGAAHLHELSMSGCQSRLAVRS
jgi:hypothetical protein